MWLYVKKGRVCRQTTPFSRIIYIDSVTILGSEQEMDNASFHHP